MAVYKGIDISRWNGAVDMNKVKAAGISFVLIQSSYGNVAAFPNQKDPRFDANVKNARAAGLSFGAYHYCYATNSAAAAREADGFVALLNKVKPIPYFVALDIEEAAQAALSSAQKSAIVEAFINVVEKAGFFCALYSYEGFLSSIPYKTRSKYSVWCANTSETPIIMHDVHQYSFKGRVSGCNGDVDMNKTSVDFTAKIKNAGLNGYSKPVRILDTDGYKRGDKGVGVYAYKQLIKAACKKKGISVTLADDGGFGGGTENAVNSLLAELGYKQNGIAGEKLAKQLAKIISG